MAITRFTATTSTLIAKANLKRRVLWAYNEGPGTLYIQYGDDGATPTVSATHYSVLLNVGDFWELPDGVFGNVYAKFGSAGTAQITQGNEFNS